MSTYERINFLCKENHITGKEIGEKIGREEQAKATAARMQKKGFSTYEIAEFIGFSREQVEKWLKENNA